jgi:hypothetical protein
MSRFTFAADLDAWFDQLADADLSTQVTALQELRSLARAIRLFDDDLAERIAEQVRGPYVDLDGIGIVQVKRGSTRKAWKHDELLPLVARKAIDAREPDPETGEILPEAEAVLNAVKDCVGISYWKVTALRARDIDPDEYVESTPGRRSVILPERTAA